MTDRVVIVGGGIAGASVAYHLAARTDRPIRVVERGAIAAETTGKSTAVFRFRGEPHLDRMKRYALGLYNDFLSEPHSMAEFDLVGRLEVATREERAGDLRAADAPLADFLEPDDLRETIFFPELATEAVEGALYLPNAGYFRPAELAFEFVERARDRSVEFRENTAVRDVLVEDGRVRGVETDAGITAADAVVCAAGPWNLRVARTAGVELPVRHTLAPILRLDPERRAVHTLPNLKHADTGHYFLGAPDGRVLAGHSPGGYDVGTEYDPGTVGESVPAEVRDGAIGVVEELLPGLADAEIVEEWVGVRSLTPDGLPVVGPAGPEDFHVVAFHSEGIQLAPAAGRAVAAAVAGEAVPGELSPGRFRDHPDADL